jgi:hypothetical protein
MCQWAATNLCSAQCEEIAKGYPAHSYQDRKIWTCRDAVKVSSYPEEWRACRDFTGKHGREEVDIGSTRNIPCPVCRICQDAEREYNRTVLDAQAAYDRALAAAEARRSRRIAGSTMFTSYVSRKHTRYH